MEPCRRLRWGFTNPTSQMGAGRILWLPPSLFTWKTQHSLSPWKHFAWLFVFPSSCFFLLLCSPYRNARHFCSVCKTVPCTTYWYSNLLVELLPLLLLPLCGRWGHTRHSNSGWEAGKERDSSSGRGLRHRGRHSLSGAFPARWSDTSVFEICSESWWLWRGSTQMWLQWYSSCCCWYNIKTRTCSTSLFQRWHV